MSAFVNGIWKSGNNLLLKLCNELGLPTANYGGATHLFYGKGARLRRLIRSSFLDAPIPVGLETPFNVGEPWLRLRLRSTFETALGGHLVCFIFNKGRSFGFDDELTELFNASIGARRLALYSYESPQGDEHERADQYSGGASARHTRLGHHHDQE